MMVWMSDLTADLSAASLAKPAQSDDKAV